MQKSKFAGAGMMLLCSHVLMAATVGDLGQIQAETILLQAQAAKAKAAADLKKNQAEAGDRIPTLPASIEGIKSPEDDGLPVVRGVWGANGKLTASLVWSSGARSEVQPGDDIPGGYRVVSISMRSVVISKGGASRHLVFSKDAPRSSSTQGNSGNPMFSQPMPLR